MTKTAYFAAGCFWGVEHLFHQQSGVIKAISGYMGGHTQNPTYKEVCYKDTGHIETVEVSYNPQLTNFETLAKFFFEIHNPEQVDGQGPDIGPQYISAIFCHEENEKHIAQLLIDTLNNKGYTIATQLLPMCEFWPAEDYHQQYYAKTGKTPYCHTYQKRF